MRIPMIPAASALGDVGDAAAAQNALTSAQLDTAAKQAKLPFIAPQAQADLSQTQLGNQKNQLLMPYVVPTAQAGIAEKNAQTGYLGSETKMNEAKLPYEQWKSKYPAATLPGQAGLFGLQDYAKQSGDNDLFNSVSNYNNAVTNAKNNPQIKNPDEVTKARVGAQNVVQEENPTMSSNDAKIRVLDYENGADQNGDYHDSQGNKLPPPSQALQNSLTYINNKSQGPQAAVQRAAASTVEKGLNSIAPLVQLASQYSGALGHIKYLKDKYSASIFGISSPNYVAAQTVSRLMPEIAAQMVTASKTRSTRAAIEAYTHAITPYSFDNDPPGTIQAWNNAVDFYHNTVANTAAQSSPQVRSALASTTGTLKPITIPNAPEVSATATQAGATQGETVQPKKTKSVRYVLKDPSGSPVTVNGKRITGNEAQTRSFIKDHPGFSRERING